MLLNNLSTVVYCLQQLSSLRKLRCRILLDQAREDILLVWAKLRHDINQTGLQHFISSNNVFRRPLSHDAVAMIYQSKTTVRMAGNEVAHEAIQPLLEDAAMWADVKAREVVNDVDMP